MPLKFPRVRYPINWGFTSKGLAGVRRSAVFHSPKNFYDPVFIGRISTNTALDASINTTCDITFAPFQNMADLLSQTSIITNSGSSNDSGYRPYIVEADGYEPLLVDVSASITANTTKLVIRSNLYATQSSTIFNPGITMLLSANELTGKKCYVRPVLCLFDLTTRPTEITLDSGSFTASNTATLADQFVIADSVDTANNISLYLRADGVTFRKTAASAISLGNTPLFLFNSFNSVNALKISINKNIAFP
jgi:hypothetical protein